MTTKVSASTKPTCKNGATEHGWDKVLNRSGTTFRKLDAAQKTDLDQAAAIALMLAQPSMIKRPVLDLGDRSLLGFKPELYQQAFS